MLAPILAGLFGAILMPIINNSMEILSAEIILSLMFLFCFIFSLYILFNTQNINYQIISSLFGIKNIFIGFIVGVLNFSSWYLLCKHINRINFASSTLVYFILCILGNFMYGIVVNHNILTIKKFLCLISGILCVLLIYS